MAVQSKLGTMDLDAPARVSFTRSSWSEPRSGSLLLRTLVLIRWVAIVGQTTTILFVGLVLRYPFPLALTLAVVGVSVILNIALTLRYPASKRLSDREAARYLAFDTVQLAVLLLLTGGLHNPYAFLMLGPAMISATVFSKRTTFLVVGLTLICASVLVFIHLPLPWPGGKHPISHVYVFGIWSALVISLLFFSINVFRAAEEGRRMLAALTETQMVLAREQRLSELGALAAAAAHELGTPLGTIALVAKEMKRELPEDCPFADDLDLLVSQSERCRDILARLTLRSEDGVAPALHRMPFIALVEMAVETAGRARHREAIAVEVEPAPELVGSEGRGADEKGWTVGQPVVPHRLEIVHGSRT